MLRDDILVKLRGEYPQSNGVKYDRHEKPGYPRI